MHDEEVKTLSWILSDFAEVRQATTSIRLLTGLITPENAIEVVEQLPDDLLEGLREYVEQDWSGQIFSFRGELDQEDAATHREQMRLISDTIDQIRLKTKDATS